MKSSVLPISLPRGLRGRAWACRRRPPAPRRACDRVAARIRATRAPRIRVRRMRFLSDDGARRLSRKPYHPAGTRTRPTASVGWAGVGAASGPAARGRGVRAVGRVPALLAAPRAGRCARDPGAPGALVDAHDGAAGGRCCGGPAAPGARRATGVRFLLLAVAAFTITFNWATYIYGVNNDRVVETSLGYFINPLVTVLMGVLHPRRAAAAAAVGGAWGSRRWRWSC